MSEIPSKEVPKDRDKAAIATSSNCSSGSEKATSASSSSGGRSNASSSNRKGKRDGSLDKPYIDDSKRSEGSDSGSRHEACDRYNSSNSNSRDGGRRSSSRGNSWKNPSSSGSGHFGKGKRDEPSGRRSYSSRYNASVRDDHAPPRSRMSNAGSVGNLNSGKGNGAYYENDRPTRDSKDFQKNQPEDPVMKLLKRITRNNIERERRLASVRQLKELILDPESKAISSSKQVFDLIDSLQNVLFERCSREIKQEVASLVGMLGNFLDHDISGFFEWVFSHANSSDGDIKVYACTALLEMLKQDSGSQKAMNYMADVMANMQHMLEGASTTSLLTVVLDVILAIAQIYPQVFGPCFMEVVDIIIGWLIDPNQGEQLQGTMSKALVSLQPFWTADMEFSAMLLGQFTEDLDIMLGQDLCQAIRDKSENNIKATREKVTALLRVFYLVMVSLGDSISTHRGGNITVDYLTQLLNKLVSGISSVSPEGVTDLIVALSNDSVTLLLHQLNSESATSVGEILLPFIINQTTIMDSKQPSSSVVVSVIRLLQKVVEVHGTQLPVYVIPQLLGPQSGLMPHRFSLCPQVVTELMSLYHGIMALKSVPLLEEAYRLVLGDMEHCFDVLLVNSNEHDVKLIQGDNPFKDVVYTKSQAQAAICYNIAALTEIANTKSNLIGMWALSPSIFTLLSQKLMLTSPWMNQHQPAVCYAILQAFHSHCQRHSNFVSSSVLVAAAPGSRMPTMSQANSLNLTHILSIVHRLLDSRTTGFDCRCLLMNWCLDILSSLTYSSHVNASEEVSALLQSIIRQGYDREYQIIQCSAQSLKVVFSTTTQWKDAIMKNATSVCLYRLSDNRKAVRDTFMAVLKEIPLDFVIRMPAFEAQEEWMSSNDFQKKQLGLPSLWHLRRSHMARLSAVTFHSHNFRHLMAYILRGISPSQTGTFHWLEAMFNAKQRHKIHSSQSASSLSGLTLSHVIENSESMLWFWATWECAQFAVMSRLRTPLGKAPETFMAIEEVIKTFAAQATSSSDRVEEDSSVELGKDGPKEKAGELTSLHRVHLLLNFIEHLDKLLYNAYEGCAVAMPMAHKVVKTFFRTNRNTCQEWLSRIRLPLVTMSLHCGMPAVAVRHASELLGDLDDAGKTKGEVFERVVVCLVKALCQLRAPESVLGVYHWCKEVTGRTWEWILAAADMARNRYERAASDFRANISGSFSSKTSSDDNDNDSGDLGDLDMEVGEEGDGEENNRRRRIRKSNKKSNSNKYSGMKGKADEVTQTFTLDFMSSQTSDCYLHLNDWESVMDWQHSMLTSSDSGVSTAFKGSGSLVDSNYIKALQFFDLGDLESVGESLELVPGMSLSNPTMQRSESGAFCWDMAGVQEVIPRSLLVAETLMMSTPKSGDEDVDRRSDILRVLQNAERQAECLMKVMASDWPPVCPASVMAGISCLTALRKHLDGAGEPLSFHSKLVCSQSVGIDVYLQLIRTVDTLLQLDCGPSEELKSQLSSLRISAASVSRKDGNLALGKDLIMQEANAYLPADLCSNASLSSTLGKIRVLPDQTIATIRLQVTQLLLGMGRLRKMLTNRLKQIVDYLTKSGGDNQREGAKLLRILGKSHSAIEALLGSIVVVSNPLASCPKDLKLEKECADISSRSLLATVKWIQADPKLLGSLTNILLSANHTAPTDPTQASAMTVQFAHLFMAENTAISQERSSLLLPGHNTWTNPSVPEVESMLGRLLHLSCIQCPTLAKAWFSMAAWCYKWGRKAVDNASDGHVTLSDEEKHQILNLLPKGMSGEEENSVLSVLSQVHNMESADEDIIDQDQSLYDDGTETTRKQLLSFCPALLNNQDGCMDRLLVIWQDGVRRLYHFYHLSAKAYFTYLQVRTQCDAKEGEGDTTICTLRLLRLLVKHAWELRDVLETGLSETPTQPWKGIIPQLFSRLSHPESYVRQSISDLLCRIGLQSPHLILYPAVVGVSNKLQVKIPSHQGLMNQLSGDDCSISKEDYDSDLVDGDIEEGSSPELQACLSAIVDSLSQQNPRMVREVQLMVQELRRVTLLWEELWLGTLNQHQSDVSRRLAQLEAEVKRVEANKSLNRNTKAAVIKEKHLTIMKPTLMTVRHLHEITSQAPQTPQERRFQASYGKQIAAALKRLEDPPDPANPQDSWALFKSIQHSLQSHAQKRSSLQLKMEDISPSLSSLSHSVIPMPGQETTHEAVTIEGVHDTAQILPTKTKPKKLIFIGSDGKRHPYLFKGLEDLHLDERIMQFLSIVNTMLYSHKRDKDRQPLYRARHYSVTPLGSRSGLIQWVEGATPLFSLYKKWQHRELTAATLKPSNSTSQNASVTPQVPSIPRPSEVFYSKLNPALAEKGLEGCENRKEWPLSVLRQVLEELMDETPEDLLSRELWCCSSSADEWWRMTQAYARSTAVMSVIGYIIGLGDRHLDNLLVDLATGEVVHIDYNVCFEKGKGLRVPEKVPFRMTPNLETALGLTGVEGTFRMAAEHVLKVMRKGREPLLTLLEAFVYDPLVDWTTGMDAGYTGAFYGGEMMGGWVAGAGDKMKMEKDITTSMFSIRLTEMDAAWTDNKQALTASLPLLSQAMESCLNLFDSLEHKTKELEDMKAVCVLLEEAFEDTQSKHAAYSLSNRYWEYAMLQAAKNQVLASVEEKIIEYSNWDKLHVVNTEKLNSLLLKQLVAEANSAPNMGLPSFASASNFLQGAGQTQVLEQCNDLEAEMIDALEKRRCVLQELVNILQTYSSVSGQLIGLFAKESRMYNFTAWLQDLLEDFSTDKCEGILSLFTDMYGMNRDQQLMKAQTVFSAEGRLKDLVTDTNTKRIKLLDRRRLELADTQQLERMVEESMVTVHQFVYENQREGQMSLLCVVTSALYTLNKRYLVMEGAASGAGDRLMDLTSREGDWFLEELCSMSANVDQFMNTLSSYTGICEADKVKGLKMCLKATHNVYVALQELNSSFRSIIIPEAVKLLQNQDPQLLAIIDQLESLIGNSSVPLDDLIKRLELAHRNAMMGIQKKEHETVLKEVQGLQETFHQLTQQGNGAGNCDREVHTATNTSTQGSTTSNGASTNSQLSAGQMLLLGLTGLFRQLEGELSDLMEWWDSLEVPSVWAKVDTVREARSLQLSSFIGTTRPLLSAMFFIKRLQAFQSFFLMASNTAKALMGETSTNGLYDDDHLAKPIKKFIADFVHKQVLGFPSQVLGYLICSFLETMGLNVTAEIELKDIGAEWKVPLDSLVKKVLDNMTLRQAKSHRLPQITTLTNALDNAWRKLDLAKRLDANVMLLNNQLLRYQQQLTRLQWLHHDLFAQAGRAANTMAEPLRQNVLAEMKKAMQTLLAHEPLVSQCLEQYSQMETNIGQRLRWAAGANPSLNGVISEFEVAITFRNNFIQEENHRVNEAVNLSQALLHMETLRTHTPESANADSNFLQLVNQCCDVCKMLGASDSSVSDLELTLINLKPLSDGEKSDHNWVGEALQVVQSRIDSGENDLEETQLSLETPQSAIYNAVVDIRAYLSTHHKLMSDIRSILKTMAKLEEQDEGEEVRQDGVRAYLASYKLFTEDITWVLKQVVQEDLVREDMDSCLDKLKAIQAQISTVYDSLNTLAPSIMKKLATNGLPMEQESGGGDGKYMDSHLKSVHAKDRESPTPSFAGKGKKEREKLTRDPKTGKAVQERNSYAVGVWRRVKMKLEGRDLDSNRRMPVSEQVDMVVKEAKNLDNLAVLYEGWTPWV